MQRDELSREGSKDIDTLNLRSLPEDIIGLITPKLDIPSLLSLSQTCTFFYNHSEIKRKIAKNVVPKAMIFDLDENSFFIISQEYEVFGCGANSYGQLGLGDTTDRDLPTPIDGIDEHEFIQVASGRGHTLFLSRRGKVYSCGENRFGQLGQGLDEEAKLKAPAAIKSIENKKIIKIACGDFFSLLLTDQGEVFTCGSEKFTPEQINFHGKKIIDIACGAHHVIFLTNQGEVYSCGSNYYGAAGQNNGNGFQPVCITSLNNRKIVGIYCGQNFSVLRSNKDEIFVCGRNYHGQLGIGNNDDQMTPVCINSLSDKNITHVACGNGNTFFISSSGEVYSTGRNFSGQLGVGDENNRNAPTIVKFFPEEEIIDVACGNGYTLFWSAKSLYVCGKNKFSAFQFLREKDKDILIPTPVRNLILSENQSVSREFSGPRPWDID